MRDHTFCEAFGYMIELWRGVGSSCASVDEEFEGKW